jgi:hypothetical protein
MSTVDTGITGSAPHKALGPQAATSSVDDRSIVTPMESPHLRIREAVGRRRHPLLIVCGHHLAHVQTRRA